MAAKKKDTPPGDDYYDALRQQKIDAGLTLDQAIEVTARQRAEDAENGLTIGETEPTPDA